MNSSGIRIADGHAFAFMAIPRLRDIKDNLFRGHTRELHGLVATRSLSVGIPFTWQHELGSKVVAAISGADLYLVATSQAPFASVSRQLRQRVHYAYFTFLLSTGYLSHETSYLVHGFVADGEATFKGSAQYPPALHPPGAPVGIVTVASLMQTFARANAVEQLFAAGKHERFGRILFAFLQAVTYPQLDRRLHQFVRCVEGFANPGKTGLKKKFTERSQLFVGRGQKQYELLNRLWDLRSVIEHLHGPFHAIDAAGERERRIELVRRSLEGESLGRFCIESFLDRSMLWPLFENEASVEAFWALGETKRRQLWGPKVDLTMLDHHFKEAEIPDSALGLEGEGNRSL